MNAAQLKKVQPGDVLKCNVRGRVFFAFAGSQEKRDGDNGVAVSPIPGKGSAVTARWVSDGEITAHYVKSWSA